MTVLTALEVSDILHLQPSEVAVGEEQAGTVAAVTPGQSRGHGDDQVVHPPSDHHPVVLIKTPSPGRDTSTPPLDLQETETFHHYRVGPAGRDTSTSPLNLQETKTLSLHPVVPTRRNTSTSLQNIQETETVFIL